MSSHKGAERESDSTAIRKLRKKLRQIENLERLQRQLTDDELAKVQHVRFDDVAILNDKKMIDCL